MSGYDIKRTVELSLSHFWRESYGSIYPILRKLTHEDLVSRRVEKGSRASDRVIYSLTPSGRDVLQRWLQQAPQPESPVRSELLLKVFFGTELAVDDMRGLLEAYAVEQRQRRQALREAAEAIEAEKEDPRSLFWRLTLRRGILVVEARARWAQEALEALAAVPAPGRSRARRRSPARGARRTRP